MADRNPSPYLNQVLLAPLFFEAIAPFLTPQDLGRFVQVSRDARAVVVADDGRVRIASMDLAYWRTPRAGNPFILAALDLVSGPLAWAHESGFSVPSSYSLATRLDFSHLSVLRVTIGDKTDFRVRRRSAVALSQVFDHLLMTLRRISSSGGRGASLEILIIDTSNILNLVPAIQGSQDGFEGYRSQDRFEELFVKPLAQLCANYPNLRVLGLPVDIAVCPISDGADVALAGARLEKLSLFRPLGGGTLQDTWRTESLEKMVTNSLVFRMVMARTSNIVTLNLVECMRGTQTHGEAVPSAAFWAFMQHVLPGVTNLTLGVMELFDRDTASEEMERLISMCHRVEV